MVIQQGWEFFNIIGITYRTTKTVLTTTPPSPQPLTRTHGHSLVSLWLAVAWWLIGWWLAVGGWLRLVLRLVVASLIFFLLFVALLSIALPLMLDLITLLLIIGILLLLLRAVFLVGVAGFFVGLAFSVLGRTVFLLLLPLLLQALVLVGPVVGVLVLGVWSVLLMVVRGRCRCWICWGSEGECALTFFSSFLHSS